MPHPLGLPDGQKAHRFYWLDCPRCKNNTALFCTDSMLLSNPPQFRGECKQCGKILFEFCKTVFETGTPCNAA